jgi:hypothetical protein
MGFFDFVGSIGKKIGSSIVNVGSKIGEGLLDVGKKVGTTALKGLDYGIQGLKIGTDFADKYSLGLTNFIPYYGAVKAGINVADTVRKLVKGEEEMSLGLLANTALDVVSGITKFKSGAKELQAWKSAGNLLRNPNVASSLSSRVGEGARILGDAYKPGTADYLETAVRSVGLNPIDPRQEGMKTLQSIRGNVDKVVNHPQFDLIRGVIDSGYESMMNNNLQRRDGGLYDGEQLVG